MAKNISVKTEIIEKYWSAVYSWIMAEGWIGCHPDLWQYIRHFADTTILIATNDRGGADSPLREIAGVQEFVILKDEHRSSKFSDAA